MLQVLERKKSLRQEVFEGFEAIHTMYHVQQCQNRMGG